MNKGLAKTLQTGEASCSTRNEKVLQKSEMELGEAVKTSDVVLEEQKMEQNSGTDLVNFE